MAFNARKAALAIAPLAAFGALAGALFVQLRAPDNDPFASPRVGLPAPQTPLVAFGDRPLVPGAALADGPILVNFWASWCGPCRIEHPQLMTLEQEGVQIVGVSYKDRLEAASAFLAGLGDPYAALGRDVDGRAGIEWGVTGMPETFVIGADGRVKAHYRGPLTEQTLTDVIRPALLKEGVLPTGARSAAEG